MKLQNLKEARYKFEERIDPAFIKIMGNMGHSHTDYVQTMTVIDLDREDMIDRIQRNVSNLIRQVSAEQGFKELDRAFARFSGGTVYEESEYETDLRIFKSTIKGHPGTFYLLKAKERDLVTLMFLPK